MNEGTEYYGIYGSRYGVDWEKRKKKEAGDDVDTPR